MLMEVGWDARGALLAWKYFGLPLPTILFVSLVVYNWCTLGRHEAFHCQNHWRFLFVIIVLVEVLSYQWAVSSS